MPGAVKAAVRAHTRTHARLHPPPTQFAKAHTQRQTQTDSDIHAHTETHRQVVVHTAVVGGRRRMSACQIVRPSYSLMKALVWAFAARLQEVDDGQWKHQINVDKIVCGTQQFLQRPGWGEALEHCPGTMVCRHVLDMLRSYTVAAFLFPRHVLCRGLGVLMTGRTRSLRRQQSGCSSHARRRKARAVLVDEEEVGTV